MKWDAATKGDLHAGIDADAVAFPEEVVALLWLPLWGAANQMQHADSSSLILEGDDSDRILTGAEPDMQPCPRRFDGEVGMNPRADADEHGVQTRLGIHPPRVGAGTRDAVFTRGRFEERRIEVTPGHTFGGQVVEGRQDVAIGMVADASNADAETRGTFGLVAQVISSNVAQEGGITDCLGSCQFDGPSQMFELFRLFRVRRKG